MGEQVALLEFEEVRQEYREKDAIGIPMSVREGYERALAEIRRRIREARRAKPGKRLGELLLEQGLLDHERLQRALAEQERRGKGELLGEVLVALGLIEEDSLLVALQAQISENYMSRREG